MKRLLFISILFYACQNKPTNTISSHQRFLDSLEIADRVDSTIKAVTRNALFDTLGLANAPVKVLSARFTQEEYSRYKSVRLSWKNVSAKRIDAIKFKWYGLDAFGEPADMGSSLQEGFGGGYTDNALNSGKQDSGTWSILSRNGKKIVLAWPYEVVFSDGTKWKSR